ncbi:substrate-binding and VWA domain-containing protein [Planosporangium sp. 12N6]|uniref:substrate-binding and VWA domain-containing protein n=1 Tax=Planosporangium spinosum TaxID=3402278 RepID=UPI003CEBB9A9
MPAGSPATVRSHRRGGPRRRFLVAPWIVFSVVGALALAGLSVGYAVLTRNSCSGQVKATVIAAPTIQPIMADLVRGWQDTHPSVRGRCAAVELTAKDSAVMAQILGANGDWDTRTAGPAPDVWVPDSSAWVRRASTAAIAERMMPDLQPSLARTPAVIAMPRPMAETLGWPKAQLTWQDVINKFADGTNGWKAYDKDWGPFRFGMTDPLKSTAGLLALMAVLDGNDDGEVSPDEQSTVLRLKQVRSVYTDGTDQIFAALRDADARGQDAALSYVSAFPALEQDVLAYNRTRPKVPLAAIYPTNGSGDADYPYLTLDAPWASRDRQAVAQSFLTYLRGPDGRAEFLRRGFRDANRAAGKDITELAGLTAKLTTLPRAVLLADSVKHSMDTWTALTRPTNILVVLDVSGSMNDAVPGTGRTKLALAKDAAKSAISLFAGDTQAGLWVFSSKQDGASPYRSLVPLGRIGDPVNGHTRKDEMLAAIDRVPATGATGLYDTIAAAQQAVLASFQPNATNLVVLMTDGRNEPDGGAGLSLDQLREQLSRNNADSDHRVPVVTVGYGEDADFGTLQNISATTGATSYTSKTGFDIDQVLLTAIFGRV